MARKPLYPDQKVGTNPTFNSLIKQLEEPLSLINVLPEDAKMMALSIPEAYIDKSEEEIFKALHELRSEPTPTVEALRNNFWMEYDRIQGSKKENVMTMANVWFGVCAKSYWGRIMRDQPVTFAYILTRSPEYNAVQAGMLSLATRRVRDILSIPLTKQDGSLQDPKVIELVLKAAAMVDLRNKGGYINRSETKNMTLIEQNTKHSYAGMFDSANMKDGSKTAAQLQQDINAQLMALEEESKNSAPLPEPKFQSNKETIVEAEYKEVK
jgi:hypothetical protein